MSERAQGSENRQDERTPEQEEVVRRRALPVAVGGALLGVGGIVVASGVRVTPFVPPSLMAMNFAFSAMLIGAGILFYAKGTKGTGLARVLCVVAILSGMVGSFLYSKQAVDFRHVRENTELANVRTIAEGARNYAAKHEGTFPGDILQLIEEGYVKPRDLLSPFGKGSAYLLEMEMQLEKKTGTREEQLKEVESGSDYMYLGSDLKGVPGDLGKEIIVAASTNTILRVNLAIAFADGRPVFITVEDAGKVMEASNAARGKMGLGALRPPAIIQGAIDDAKKK